jgi:hypothetical protein
MERIKAKHPEEQIFMDFVSSEKLTLILWEFYATLTTGSSPQPPS